MPGGLRTAVWRGARDLRGGRRLPAGAAGRDRGSCVLAILALAPACHSLAGAYARRCERKVEQVIAVCLYAGRGAVALAGAVPAEFQRILRAGLLRWRLLSTQCQMVAADGHAGGDGSCSGSLLLPFRQFDAVGQLRGLRTHYSV